MTKKEIVTNALYTALVVSSVIGLVVVDFLGGLEMGERKYYVLSLKHLYPWKFGETLCLWGYKRTNDNEDRCYGGYSDDIQRAELYSSEEFLKNYGRCTKNDPLTALIPSELKALKKVFDCVLVPKDVVERYYKDCGLIK